MKPSPSHIVGGESLDTPARAQAYIASAQRDLNVHLRRLGSPDVLAVDGEWDDHTQRAFEQVCRILGLEADRTVRTFRLIAAAAAQRTDAEARRAATEGAAFERELRRQFSASDDAPQAAPRRPRTVVGGSSLPADARSRAYVAGAQRDLNHHLIALGSPTVLAVDGRWGEETERAFKRVCRVLGIEPVRSVRAFRVLAGASAPRSEAELELAAKDGAEYATALRNHFAHVPEPKPEPEPKPSSLEATLRRAGVRWPDIIARECERHGLPASLVLAVIEVETGFRNVFGHDGVRNPVKSPSGGLKEVTEAEYKRYLRFRAQGLGNQGVGPMQLTSPGLQDRADALGGCWKVGPNIRVGCEFLAGNIQRLGLRAGVIAYNGGAAYADKVFPAQQRWRAKLGGSSDGGASGGGSGPRTLKVPMRGKDVLALQKLVNRRLAELDVPTRIAEDGDFGPETRTAARRVAYALGLTGMDRGITPAHRVKMRKPTRRTRDELARAAARKPWLRKLQASAARAGGSGDYPLGVRGLNIGRPYQGTHTRGNWQSDNAVDLRVPEGTAVLALDDGVIVKTFKSPSGVTAGWQVTLRSADNAWFYGHLKTVSVRAGERVRKGQTIGTSGSANGVPHLHLGQQHGTPRFQ
jgi:murein DD-endopeptidase MepM/ murein hydrolase activator NlpD